MGPARASTVSRRRQVVLEIPAALGFALLPELSPLRQALGGAPGSATVWLLSLSAALPLVVRRIRPVPVFLFVLAVAVVSVPFGLAPTAFVAAAYTLFLVAQLRRPPAGLSAVAVGGACAVGAAGLTMTGRPPLASPSTN